MNTPFGARVGAQPDDLGFDLTQRAVPYRLDEVSAVLFEETLALDGRDSGCLPHFRLNPRP